jgi:hypothetical protein
VWKSRHCDNGASQISQRFARRPYATLSKIFDFVKVTEGAQRRGNPRMSDLQAAFMDCFASLAMTGVRSQ